MTAGISRAVANSSLFSRFVLGSFGRHKYQDFGDLSKHDRETNDYALEHGGRIISSYTIPKHLNIAESMRPQTKIWIITEGIEGSCKADVRGTSDRVNRKAGGSASYTTVLFPSEY